MAVVVAAAWRRQRQYGGGCGSLAAVAVVAALMCQKHRNILIPTYATINKGGNLNSLTPKSVPVGTKLVLFGRYILNIYVGIV